MSNIIESAHKYIKENGCSLEMGISIMLREQEIINYQSIFYKETRL